MLQTKERVTFVHDEQRDLDTATTQRRERTPSTINPLKGYTLLCRSVYSSSSLLGARQTRFPR